MQLAPPTPPRWSVACKVALAALLACGALFPELGGFAGKGMAYRLPLFLAPALVVPIRWWRRRSAYAVALDAALTLPFLFDTACNAVGLYDHFDHTDDALHFVNWFVLVGGIAITFAIRPALDGSSRWLVGLAATGIGAMAAIAWEVAEYGVMRAGVGGLSLTYADTLADLVLGTAGGAVGAWLALGRLSRAAPPGSSGPRARPDGAGRLPLADT